jgi:hypothetical protein
VGDLHGDFFVLAKQHRRVVLAVVDQRVVQPAVAGAGIQRDVLEIVALDHVDDNVGLPTLVGLFNGLCFRRRLCHGIFLLRSD